MAVEAFEGIVEQGRIRLLSNVELPEQARVFVVVPSDSFGLPSPRVGRPEHTRNFEKTVFEVDEGGELHQ